MDFDIEATVDQTTLQCPACSGDMFYAENLWKCSVCGEEVQN